MISAAGLIALMRLMNASVWRRSRFGFRRIADDKRKLRDDPEIFHAPRQVERQLRGRRAALVHPLAACRSDPDSAPQNTIFRPLRFIASHVSVR